MIWVHDSSYLCAFNSVYSYLEIPIDKNKEDRLDYKSFNSKYSYLEIPTDKEDRLDYEFEFKDHISKANLKCAISTLKKASNSRINSKDQVCDEILIVESRLSRLEKNKRIGTISFTEYDQIINQITQALFAISESIFSEN